MVCPLALSATLENSVCMAGESVYFLASGEVPYLDCLIPASTDQGLFIGAQCNTPNITCMTSKGVKQH